MSARSRRILAGLFWLLASIGVMASALAFWAHQTVLTTSGWTGLMDAALDDPAVVQGTSEIVSQRISDAVGLEQRVADLLPGPSTVLAPAITGRVEGFVADGIATFMGTDAFRKAWDAANEKGHEAAMKAIRGGGDVVSTEGGTIEVNVLPVIVAGLEKLQEAGFLPASWEIPQLEDGQLPDDTMARLEKLLGRDLPTDFGTIALVQSDSLATVQQAVRLFDIAVVALVVATAVCLALALYLSARRLRMVIWLALGAIGALGLARLVSRTVLDALAGSLEDGPEGDTIRGILRTIAEAVTGFAVAVIAVAVVVLIVAAIVEARSRRAERAAEPGAEAGAEAGERPSLREIVRAHAVAISIAGVVVIGLVALWWATGPDVALPAAVAVGVWLAVIWLIARRDEPPPGEAAPGASGSPATSL